MPASMTRLFIHFVWGTYQRTPWLVEPVRELVYRTIVAKCREMDAQVIVLNGVDDHVHLLVKLPPTLAIAQFIAKVKGISSYAVTHHWPDDPFKWQDGYGAFTVSEKVVPTVREYIATQQAHHTAKTCNEVLDPAFPSS
jgi:putative transposase